MKKVNKQFISMMMTITKLKSCIDISTIWNRLQLYNAVETKHTFIFFTQALYDFPGVGIWKQANELSYFEAYYIRRRKYGSDYHSTHEGTL